MNTKMCKDCLNKATIATQFKDCKNRDTYCKIAKKRIKYVKDCPLGYDYNEYNALLQKGEEYDRYRLASEGV